MSGEEKALGLLEGAEGVGLRLQFDSGFVSVKGGTDGQTELLEELAKNIVHVRRLAKQRAITAHGKKFLDARIWSPAHGGCTLPELNNKCTLTVALDKAPGSRSSHTFSRAEDLLAVVEDASDPANAVQEKEAPQKKRFDVF